MADLEFLFDFGSPNAYLARRALQQMQERHDISVSYTPILLGGVFKSTGNQAPWLAFGDIPHKMTYMQAEIQRFIRRHGLTQFQFNPNFPINTLTLMRAAIAAQEEGVFDAYLETGMRAMWEDGVNMGDPETFAATLNAAGLDGDGLLSASQTPAIKKALMENTSDAVERGVFGIPSFFWKGELYFGKETLREIESDLA